MDLIKSILITLLIFVLLGGGLFYIGKKQEIEKANANLVKAKDEFGKKKYKNALVLLKYEPSKEHLEDYYLLKLKTLIELENFYQAEEVSKKLLEINDKNHFYYYLISLIHGYNWDYEKTEQALKKAIELQPENLSYKMRLARVYSNGNKTQQALDLYKNIRETDSRYQIAWAEAATVLENNKNFDESLKLRKASAEKFPDHLSSQYKLAALYEKLKNKKQAVGYYKKAAQLDKHRVSDAIEKIENLTNEKYHYIVNTKTQRIPLTIIDNLMIIKAKADNFEGNFLIDTGASLSVIYERFLKKSNIHVYYDKYGVLEMANGSTEYAPVAYFDFKIGQKKFNDSRVYILTDTKTINFDGIIGSDILKDLDYYIDQEKECIVINY